MAKRTAQGRLYRLFSGIAFTAVLAGCVVDPGLFLPSQKQVEDDTPFTEVPKGQAWANAPAMTLVMQRGLLNGSEQRIGLQNDIAVPGDNLLILRSRSGTAALGRLRFEEFMTRVGGAPMPFQALRPGDLLSGEDSLGSYLWTEQILGTEVTCVFGLRRLTPAMRVMPGGSGAMDVMLRNCIRGTTAEALAPMLDASVGVRLNAGDGGGGTRMLSPLAAPGLE